MTQQQRPPPPGGGTKSSTLTQAKALLLGPGPAAGKPACRAGLAGAAPPPFFLAGLAGLRRHAEIFEFLNF